VEELINLQLQQKLINQIKNDYFYSFNNLRLNIWKYTNIHEVYVRASSYAKLIIFIVSLNLLSVELDPKTIIIP